MSTSQKFEEQRQQRALEWKRAKDNEVLDPAARKPHASINGPEGAQFHLEDVTNFSVEDLHEIASDKKVRI